MKNSEIARKILEEKQIRPEQFSSEQLNIFQWEVIDRQIKEEKENDSFMQDTTLLDVLAYAKDAKDYDLYLKKVTNHLNKQIYDIIFYTPIEFDIEDDWLRHIDKEFQKTIDERIRLNLWIVSSFYKGQMKVYTITGTTKERINKVMNVLNNN